MTLGFLCSKVRCTYIHKKIKTAYLLLLGFRVQTGDTIHHYSHIRALWMEIKSDKMDHHSVCSSKIDYYSNGEKIYSNHEIKRHYSGPTGIKQLL